MVVLDPILAGFSAGVTYMLGTSVLTWWQQRRRNRKPKPGEAFLVAPWSPGTWSPQASDNVNVNIEPESWGGGDRWSGLSSQG